MLNYYRVVFTVNVCKELDGLKGFCCFMAWGKCLEHLKKYRGDAKCDAYGAFPLHGTVRFGTARYGTAQFGSVCISTAV